MSFGKIFGGLCPTSWLNVAKVSLQSVRNKGFRHPGAVIYPGGIRYYPRFKNEKEPDIEPTKLFRVERIKSLKGLNRTERVIMKYFGLYCHGVRNVTVLKNTPENNVKLWKVKHLIEIKPIHFPYGEPTMDDINHTVLEDSGDCIVTKKLAINPERIKAREDFMNNPAKMTNQTIEKECRLRWLNPWTGGY